MAETIFKGEYACLKVELRANELGAVVSRPSTDCSYDRVIDWKGRLWRVQVKYADGKCSHSQGAVFCNLRRKAKGGVYYSSQIDVLLVYLPSLDKICWFEPVVFSGKKTLNIRLQPAKKKMKTCVYADQHSW